MSQLDNIPPLTISGPEGAAFKLEGWEAFNLWALRNHSGWNSVVTMPMATALSEVDLLRLLAGNLLRQNVELAELRAQDALRAPIRILMTKDELQ